MTLPSTHACYHLLQFSDFLVLLFEYTVKELQRYTISNYNKRLKSLKFFSIYRNYNKYCFKRKRCILMKYAFFRSPACFYNLQVSEYIKILLSSKERFCLKENFQTNRNRGARRKRTLYKIKPKKIFKINMDCLGLFHAQV